MFTFLNSQFRSSFSTFLKHDVPHLGIYFAKLFLTVVPMLSDQIGMEQCITKEQKFTLYKESLVLIKNGTKVITRCLNKRELSKRSTGNLICIN